MSAPTIVLDVLAAAVRPLTMDEIVAATSLPRHLVNNVLTAFQRLEVADHAPATYALTESGRKYRMDRLRARARKVEAAEAKEQRQQRRERKDRAAPVPLSQPRPAAPLHLGQMVDHALRTQPNSVFALGSMS